MMIATLLLVVNFIFLALGKELFSFWHFAWIYPLEILIYIIVYFLFMFIFYKSLGVK